MNVKNALVKDRNLYDDNGNSCRIEMYHLSGETYELFLHDFNDAIPRRKTGSLSEMLNAGQLWFDAKIAAGFQEPMPAENIHCWRS